MVQLELQLLLRISEPNEHSEVQIIYKAFDFTPI